MVSGAVTWGSGATGVTGVVSAQNSLVGSVPGDGVGGAVALTNGNYVVGSSFWNSSRGAVTWGDGATGVRGVITAQNSLVGSTPGDQVGYSITALTNGNYVVDSRNWNDNRGR